MARPERVLEVVLSGRSDANVRFSDLRGLLKALGFGERTRGSHHIYFREGVEALLNLQADGDKAKSYQVREVRQVILRHRLFIKRAK